MRSLSSNNILSFGNYNQSALYTTSATNSYALKFKKKKKYNILNNTYRML